jgi:hypothetical protein
MSHPFIKNSLAIVFVPNDLATVLILVFHKGITSVRNHKILWHDLRNKQMLITSNDRLALGAAPRSILLWRYMAARSTTYLWNFAPVTHSEVATEPTLPVAGIFI